MLDLHRIAAHLPGRLADQTRTRERLATRLALALAAIDDCEGCWEDLRDRAETTDRSWLVARLRESPAARHEPMPRPTPVTVVASDGSQVFPDRHREPHLFLVNIARLAFQYGTHEAPFIEALPHIRSDDDALADILDEVVHDASPEVVSAIRDELELKALLDTALQTRVDGRPIVALADGTLIRWMLRAMRDDRQADRFVARYAALLEGFREARIPVASFVSLPRNTEVVNLLRLHRGEPEEPRRAAPGAGADGAAPESGSAPPKRDDTRDTIEGVLDRHVFEQRLLPGERSAVFESSSKVQERYGAADRICYFYLHVPGRPEEIARVELPRWLADESALVDLVHAVVLRECDKGDGYPLILAEAHERAVVRGREKAAFHALVEHALYGSGRAAPTSRKAASKDHPRA